MTKPDVSVVLGTRPEIIKLASVIRRLGSRAQLIDTAQHYDADLSGVFFDAFSLALPIARLEGVGGAARGVQIGRMIEALTMRFERERPAVVVVQGDTNTTTAAAQAASYAGAAVVHVEAGLRSRDRAMPEEINRSVVGVVADLHCSPTARAAENLRAEGVPADRILVTGNTIVEATLESLPSRAESLRLLSALGLEHEGYVLASIHRPENADDPRALATILAVLGSLDMPVVLPVHPRTRARCAGFGLLAALERLRLLPPVDHATFLALQRHARLVVSDSGGVQEEVTVLKRPLVVVRRSTERPEALEAGFATLALPNELSAAIRRELARPDPSARLGDVASPFGDGRAGERIGDAILALADAARLETPGPVGSVSSGRDWRDGATARAAHLASIVPSTTEPR